MWRLNQLGKLELVTVENRKQTRLCDSPCLVIHHKETVEKIDKSDTIEAEPTKVADQKPSLSRLDEIGTRYWNTHQNLANSFDDSPLWDVDGVVLAACSFARDILGSSKINYNCISTRVAICACYTISWKFQCDDLLMIPFGHSFLTTCYGAMFFNLKGINNVEILPERLHRCIEHIEGQIIVLLAGKIFAYAALNPVCNLMTAAEELVSVDSDEDEINPNFLLVLNKVIGFFGVFIQISESNDTELTAVFNDLRIHGECSRTIWTSGLLLLFSRAATHAGVGSIVPSAVFVRCKTPTNGAVEIAKRVASMYIECHDRLNVGDVLSIDSMTDKIALKMVALDNIRIVLSSLT